MKKNRFCQFIFVIITAIVLTDCSKKDPAPVVCYLTEYSETGTSGSEYTETLGYNDKHQVISITDTNPYYTDVITFVYASNGNVQTGTFQDGSTWTYAFDSNNRMIQRVKSTGGQTTTIVYNNAGQAVLMTYVDLSCSGCSYNREYTYPNTTTHNYSHEKYSTSTTVTDFGYTYDTHPNPYKPVLYSSTGTDNNIAMRVITGSSGTTTTTFSYTYNDRGYPLTRTSSTGEETTYTYNCP